MRGGCSVLPKVELIIRRAMLPDGTGPLDVGIAGGRICAIAPALEGDAPIVEAGGCLLVPGLVETHFHLDKTCIMDRCAPREGTVQEAVRLTSAAKRDFTADDVYSRGKRVLERCIGWGTTRMRTHVEVDPGIGMTGFEGVQALQRDFAWAMDIELCVFPQEGLLNNPGTEALLVEGLRRGARVIGAVPYVDTDPRGQIDRIFAIAREWDADIDMHLDLADTPDGMQAEYVCRKTEEYGWGGRVAIGHVTQASLLPPDRFAALAATLARAGVAVTVLPTTDLYLMGRSHDHAVPRGVVKAEGLRTAGVTCSIATNNVLNPFTPYGDANLLRMANLYANVCHVARPEDLAACLAMVTTEASRLMRAPAGGVAVGAAADLVLLDAAAAHAAVAELAAPLWGMKAGRMTFRRERPVLHRPA
jgi:cytosine deaminase